MKSFKKSKGKARRHHDEARTFNPHALRHSQGLRLVHNVVPFRPPNLVIDSDSQELNIRKDQAQVVVELAAKLRALAPPGAEALGTVTEVDVTESREAAEAICSAVEQFDAEVICIGSHTRLGSTAKVLGSVSLAVPQGSRRPVLVVWPPAE